MASFSNQLNSLKWTGRALRYRNYRLFFMGQGISLIGTWMQRMALMWFVYERWGSPWLLGALDFSGQIPAFVLAPWAGLAADRFNRHRLIVITQAAAMLQAAILAVLVLTDTVQVWHLFALSIFLGCVNGFDIPIRQSFVVEMVENRADLGNAIALNSSLFNGARQIGSLLAGAIVAISSAGICFLLNAASYLAVIWALLAMKITRRDVSRAPTSALHGLREGIRYLREFRSIPYLLLNLSLVSIAGTPYMTLMSVFAKDVLHGGPESFGFLLAASGVGATIGAVYLATRKSPRGLGRLIAIAMCLYSVGLLAFAESEWLWLSLVIVLFTGFGMMLTMASTNTLVQTLVDEDKRGRVMALWTMAFMGAAPIGSLWGGFAATHIGAPRTVYIGALLCMVTTAIFIRRVPALRRETAPILDQWEATHQPASPAAPPPAGHAEE